MKDWLKPGPSKLTAKEFSQEIYLLFHHTDTADKWYHEAALARGKKSGIRYGNPTPEQRAAYEAEDNLIATYEKRTKEHRALAEAQVEVVGRVNVRLTGPITKVKENWVGKPGLIGGHMEREPYTVDLVKSKQTVWFKVKKDLFGCGVVGQLEYNGGDATFNPKEVDIEYLP